MGKTSATVNVNVMVDEVDEVVEELDVVEPSVDVDELTVDKVYCVALAVEGVACGTIEIVGVCPGLGVGDGGVLLAFGSTDPDPAGGGGGGDGGGGEGSGGVLPRGVAVPSDPI